MLLRRDFPFIILSGVIAFTLPSGSAGETSSQGWVALSQMNVGEALETFQNKEDPNRSTRLGTALSLFNSQPHTDTKQQTAAEQLTRLRTENPDDDIGIAAAFYLARIRQITDRPGADEQCRAIYRTLLRDYPGHPIAEMAAPKLAILLLLTDVSAADWELAVQEIETLIPQLQSPNSRRDTRLVLAQALLKLKSDHARALPLIDYCLQHNLVVRPPRRSKLLLQAAESARILNRPEVAAHYYRLLVTEFPYNSETDEVRRRLAKVEQEARS